MIIFDLDGCLADCEHRRHFVDPTKNDLKFIYDTVLKTDNGSNIYGNYYKKETKEIWKPDWQSFYEACGEDKPIEPVINILSSFDDSSNVEGCRYKIFEMHIWTGRCESVRIETHVWLMKYLGVEASIDNVKMRPIGDNTPHEQLKERWLDEALTEGNKVDFVFDSDPRSINMWRRRGIFVFNCCQHDGEF